MRDAGGCRTAQSGDDRRPIVVESGHAANGKGKSGAWQVGPSSLTFRVATLSSLPRQSLAIGGGGDSDGIGAFRGRRPEVTFMLLVAGAMLLGNLNLGAPHEPIPLSSPASWLSALGPRANGIDGRTVVHLEIDVNGAVAACTITMSSGSSALDEEVCRATQKRARFAPAEDAQGNKIPGGYVLPVLWGHPSIEVEPYQRREVITLRHGLAVSCKIESTDGKSAIDPADKCFIYPDLLFKYFGSDYVHAKVFVIESAIIPGSEAVAWEAAIGRRVILKEAAVAIGADGRIASCKERISQNDKGSLADCAGYEPGRKFTGLKSFVSTIAWTLISDDEGTAPTASRPN